MIADSEVPRCSAEEWKEFQGLVRHGMLFELIEWTEAGRPTLRPEKKHWSALETAATAPNLSMTQVLWERAWQDEWEAECAVGRAAYDQTSVVVMRYLLSSGAPIGHVTGLDLCLFHDLELVRLGMRRGVSVLEPDGWAAAFRHVGCRPLIRFYLEEKDRIPGLKRDAVQALCECIEESRLRAVALGVSVQLLVVLQGLGAEEGEARRLQPYHVWEVDGCWYVIGLDLNRGAMRTFALPRISRLRVSRTSFERPADFDGASYLRHSFGVWTAPEDQELHLVRVELRDYAARMAQERRWHPTQELRILNNAGTRVEVCFQVSRLEEVVRWVLSWGSKAKVLGPPELKRMVRDEVKAMG